MSNYYVRRSGDYLEHTASALSGAGGKGKPPWAKYLAKIQRAGKTVYIYSQQQLQNLRNATYGVRRTFDNATGLSARRMMNTNRQRVKNVSGAHNRNMALRNAKKYEAQYNKSLAGRIENAGNAARNFIGSQAKKARRAGESFAGSVSKEAYKVGQAATNAKKKAGKFVDTNITGATAKKNVKTSMKNWEGYKNKKKGKAADTAYRVAQEQQRKYDKSLAGKIDRVFGRGQSVSDMREDYYERRRTKKRKAASVSKSKKNAAQGRYYR